MVLAKRKFASNLDPKVRLTPIEAAREHANLNGKQFDEKEWKKLSPDQKSDRLTKECNYTEFTEYDKPVNRRAVDAELDLIRKEKISPLDPVEAHRQPDHQRDRDAEAEAHLAAGEDRQVQRRAVRDDRAENAARDHHRTDLEIDPVAPRMRENARNARAGYLAGG